MFSEGFDTGSAGKLHDGHPVRLPHNAVDLPLNYFDERVYQREFCYQKEIPGNRNSKAGKFDCNLTE